MKPMSTTQYNYAWETKWDDMKKYGPFSRHLRRIIKHLMQPLSFESILDVGCGQGTLLSELCVEFPHIKPYGIDISSSGIKLTKQRVPNGQFWVLDASQEYLEQKFDLLVCSEVLEHIPDDMAVLRNMARMTNKYLIISTVQGRMRSFEAGEVGHVRNYAYGELVEKVEKSGFKVTKVIEWGFPFYSPLYRNLLEWTGGSGTTGEFGLARKLLANAVYSLFLLNSWKRGDEIVVLAEPLLS
jgi:2-polyprenyl-3-methyl-5-hydroxy-6-metoxy-1,4-benzoquinol methylase